MMAFNSKAFDLLGDDIVDLPTKNESSKHKKDFMMKNV